ncbi:MAG: hypothetical protein KI790_20055 [Cyclobacteriaceae bacterium]|nr:hypothetical protein [Cyclobacteriaceae bacterium HetDA_MAG_MS6]
MQYQENWNDYQKALYLERQGDWEKAHDIIQDIHTAEAAWIHAYLHRKEGDDGNAGYWYSRAIKNPFQGSLDEEWEQLWTYFLQ